MSISTPFIHRPVGTTLLTLAVAMAGILAYQFLPVAPLPQVDFPTISINASLPGASPEIMASSVATPLEREFGRIAAINEMTSGSSMGSANVRIQFDLTRNIYAAARDVQAAINAARSNLPTDLPGNPNYRIVNPADAPILILSLTSDIYGRGRMYDAASTILAQRLSQVPGVGQVGVNGGALPGVRVEVNPTKLAAMGLSLENIRTILQRSNSDSPKGTLGDENRQWTLDTTDQLLKAKQYAPLIVAYHNGAAVRLRDVAQVIDSVENIRNIGMANGKPAILMVISRQPGANIIETCDNVLNILPELRAEIPAGMDLEVAMDRTTTIRASVRDTEFSLCLSVVLVVLVVFFFLRDLRSTIIPSVAVPVSLVGTFGIMWLLNYSVDLLSLMALTIATGFVVDDAIVVIENITRHLEEGIAPLPAALQGAKEIGFTVISMSSSLVAVFLPILLMSGLVGRLLREFAVTLSVAIGVSLVVSLTTTPMMCALFLRPRNDAQRHGVLYRACEWLFDGMLSIYERTLRVVLRHPLTMIVAMFGTVGLTVFLFMKIPSGNLVPDQDTGRMGGNIVADQTTSYQSITKIVGTFAQIVKNDPAVSGEVAFAGGGTMNTGFMFIILKPIGQRTETMAQVIDRMRIKLGRVPGATMFLWPFADVRFGGRSSNASYQYTLQSDDLKQLRYWSKMLLGKLRTDPDLQDVSSDEQDSGVEADLNIDRVKARTLGISTNTIDNILYDAFGQRQVSTMYNQLNQYHVVMEVSPQFWQDANGLKYILVPTSSGSLVRLNEFAKYSPAATPLVVNHQGQFPAITLSFNMKIGTTLDDAVARIQKTEEEIGMPSSVHGGFEGTAKVAQESQFTQIILIVAAIITVYIVLGMLYESLVHPITILSTLPSAGVGALLALFVCHLGRDLIGLIGIILLIGIVKKNAIMMIDFALDVQRREGKTAREAIFQACMLRFRPIMMTTMAAMFGGLPLALGHGNGAELRQPLGIAIVGGLLFSQLVTLYTTPVIYLYLERLRVWISGSKKDMPRYIEMESQPA